VENAADVAGQGATVAPEKALSKKGTSPKKGGPKAKKSAEAAKPEGARKATAPCAESNGASMELTARQGRQPRGDTVIGIGFQAAERRRCWAASSKVCTPLPNTTCFPVYS